MNKVVSMARKSKKNSELKKIHIGIFNNFSFAFELILYKREVKNAIYWWCHSKIIIKILSISFSLGNKVKEKNISQFSCAY